MINISVLIILGSGHMKDWSGLVGSAFTSPNGLVEKKVSVEACAMLWQSGYCRYVHGF